MNPEHAIEVKERPQQLAMMLTPPADPVERDRIGEELWTGLILRFEQGLSPQDLALWKNPPQDAGTSREHLRILHSFDDFLLHRFADWGFRLLWSPSAQRRIAQWEIHNMPELLE